MYFRGAQTLGNMFLLVKLCIVPPDTHWFSVWNLFHVTIVAPEILRWFIDFFEYMLTSEVYECTLSVVLTTGGIHEKKMFLHIFILTVTHLLLFRVMRRV
jgi:hypothetical protein